MSIPTPADMTARRARPDTATSADSEASTLPLRGYALAPDEGVEGRGPEVKASRASTGGSLAMYRSVVDGEGPPRHEHRHEDETIVVLEGTLEAYCGDDTWQVGPGSVVFLPRGLPHTFRSIDGPAEILFLVTPGHLDDFFRLKDEARSPAQIAELVSHFF